MNVTATWCDGRAYNGPSHAAVVRAMRLDNMFTEALTDEAYMQAVAARARLLAGVPLRTSDAQAFLHDLARGGFVRLMVARPLP